MPYVFQTFSEIMHVCVYKQITNASDYFRKVDFSLREKGIVDPIKS